MKFFIFGLALVVGVPAMVTAGAGSLRLRGWLLTALVFSTVVGDLGNINFVSMESYRGPDRGFEVTMTDLIAWALILVLLIRERTRLRWFPTNSIAMIALMLVATVTTVLAPEPIFGAFTVFKLVRFWILYWVVVNCLHTGTSRLDLWRGLVLIGVFLTVMVLHQKYVLGLYRVHGPFDHSNTIPPYVNLILPVLLVWGIADRELGIRRAWISGLAVMGMTLAVVATMSRAGMLLAVVGILGALVVAGRGRTMWRTGIATAVVMVALGAGGFKASDSIVDRFIHAPESSGDARDELNAVADHMVRDHPLGGVGLNNFSYVLTNTAKYSDHLDVLAAEEEAGVAHNIYRLTAAEMGYPGLILLVVIMVRFAGVAAWHGRRRRDLADLLLLACFLGLATQMASGFLEWTFRTTPVLYLFAIVSGLTVALREGRRDRPSYRAGPLGLSGRVVP